MRRSTGAADIYLGSCYNSGNIWRTSHLYPELCLIYIWGNCIIILCSLTTSAAAFDIICKNMKKINTYCQCYHSSMSTTYHNPQKDIFLMFFIFFTFLMKFIFSLNCQIAVQKYVDYYPAFEMSRECKFIKVTLQT